LGPPPTPSPLLASTPLDPAPSGRSAAPAREQVHTAGSALAAWGRSRVLHSIPGRVRIRLDPHRGYHVRWDDLKEQLERSATATRVRTNPASHSIVVEYDPTSLRASDVCDHVNDVVARCWSPSAGQPGVPSARHGAERAAVFHPRSRVVHALAGRLRIRIDAPLLSDGQWEGLARVLEALDGIEGVRPNAASRSVTISFDPALEADDVRLRPGRSSSRPRRWSGGLSPLPQPSARRALRLLRQRPPGLRPGRRREPTVLGLPRATQASLRDLRCAEARSQAGNRR
jgi:hypothetical protein